MRALLFAAWLLLNQSLAPGHLLLAALFAIVLPPLAGAGGLRWHRPALALRLAGRVVHDIVLSNLEVARRVLGPESAIVPRFVWLPLEVESRAARVALASIITLTPGTVSAAFSADGRRLRVHALHCPDDDAEAALRESVRTRYEAPLKEIFG